jgi:hypothetical protein
VRIINKKHPYYVDTCNICHKDFLIGDIFCTHKRKEYGHTVVLGTEKRKDRRQ